MREISRKTIGSFHEEALRKLRLRVITPLESIVDAASLNNTINPATEIEKLLTQLVLYARDVAAHISYALTMREKYS